MVEHETADVISPAVRRRVAESLERWRNEQMPLGHAWVEPDIADLTGEDRAIARLTLVLAKAPYQVTERLVEPLLAGGEARFVRILAWAASVGARRFASIVAVARERGRPLSPARS